MIAMMRKSLRCISSPESLRVHVPNNWVLRVLVLVIIEQVLGKYMIIRYLAHPGDKWVLCKSTKLLAPSTMLVHDRQIKWGFPKIRGTFLRGPHNKDHSILGSILESPYFGKLPNQILRLGTFFANRPLNSIALKSTPQNFQP